MTEKTIKRKINNLTDSENEKEIDQFEISTD